MTIKSDQQVVAFAAIFQAASLVEQLARTGDVPVSASEPLVASLFKRNPENFHDIYGNAKQSLNIGLHQLEMLCSKDPKGINPDVTRYVLSILHLERKLSRNKGMMQALGEGIEQANRQANHFSLNHENTIAALANTYKQTLSSLSYRIRVSGNPTYLQNNHTANKVRTLLLAGIRAAILWRQVGGRRWQLITSRKRYLSSVHNIQKS